MIPIYSPVWFDNGVIISIDLFVAQPPTSTQGSVLVTLLPTEPRANQPSKALERAHREPIRASRRKAMPASDDFGLVAVIDVLGGTEQ